MRRRKNTTICAKRLWWDHSVTWLWVYPACRASLEWWPISFLEVCLIVLKIWYFKFLSSFFLILQTSRSTLIIMLFINCYDEIKIILIYKMTSLTLKHSISASVTSACYLNFFQVFGILNKSSRGSISCQFLRQSTPHSAQEVLEMNMPYEGTRPAFRQRRSV